MKRRRPNIKRVRETQQELPMYSHRCSSCRSTWTSTFRLPGPCIFCGHSVVRTKNAPPSVELGGAHGRYPRTKDDEG